MSTSDVILRTASAHVAMGEPGVAPLLESSPVGDTKMRRGVADPTAAAAAAAAVAVAGE